MNRQRTVSASPVGNESDIRLRIIAAIFSSATRQWNILGLTSRLRGLVLVAIMAPATVMAGDLRPFTTDGCSVFPDGTSEHHSLWSACCVKHDVAYWQGGSSDERRVADEALAQCVRAVGRPKTASLMLAGVRMGGTPYLPTSYRWGYGWPFFRGYKKLSEQERQEVNRQLKTQQAMLDAILERLETENE